MTPYFDASPDLVDDLPASTPAAAPTPAPAPAPAAAAAAPAVAPATEQALAEAFYSSSEIKLEVPPDVLADRQAHESPEDRFYSETAPGEIESFMRQAFPFSPGDSSEAHAAVVKAASLEVTASLRAVGFASTEALRDLGRAVRETEGIDAAGLPSFEAQARAELAREFGDRADAALQAAQALVRRDPRLHEFLHKTGAGSHPAVVLRFAREGLRQRASGRLK